MSAVISNRSFSWRTLSTEFDKLLIERVHVLLQLPFLMLHILQVLSQGLDFSFMLQTKRKQVVSELSEMSVSTFHSWNHNTYTKGCF